MPKTTVIAAFYNKIDYLKLVLAGLERQTEKDFELIIADDGSSEKVVSEIEAMCKNYSFHIKHIWQSDNGFRKNRILNQAILAAQSDHLIFIDADCVPHKSFVAEHLSYKLSGTCFTGRRVNLSRKITAKLTDENVRNGILEKSNFTFLVDSLFGQTNYVERGIYLKNNFLRENLNKKKRGLLGCNFSLFKEDIKKINGFDERYEAPSIGEDSDIQYRLELLGIKIKSLNHIAIQYHLYHKLQERLQKNLDLFEEVKKSSLAFTPFGIAKI